MKVGDPIRITTEFGKYWHYNTDVSGMVGILLRLNRGKIKGDTATVWLSNGQTCEIDAPHVFLEVVDVQSR